MDVSSSSGGRIRKQSKMELAVETMPRLLRKYAEQNPNNVAIRQKRFGIWKELTWKGYYLEAEKCAHGLAACGYSRGDHLAILSENRQEWLIAELGMQLIGLVPAGVYPTSPSPEVLHILKSTDARAVICEDQEQVDKVLEIIDELPLLQQVIFFESKGLRSYTDNRLMAWDKVLGEGERSVLTDTQLVERSMSNHNPDDVALIVPTSGSTGPPKAAMITFRNIEFIGRATAETIDQTATDQVISYLPLCHVAEQLFSVFLALYGGYTANFGESLRTVQQDLRDIAPTVFLGVPRIWEKMRADILIQINNAKPVRKFMLRLALRAARNYSNPWQRLGLLEGLQRTCLEWLVFRHLRNALGLTRCRIAISGAAPIATDTLDFFRGLGIPLMEGFGMTETAGASAIQRIDKSAMGRIGFPLPGVEMRVAVDGELLIRGPCVFSGYYKNSHATAEAIKDDWLHTGDIAEIHKDGSVSIVDRKKDIAITEAGKNITPSLIENAMKVSPYIKECVVIADGRRFPSALIQIDFDVVANWAEARGLAYTTFRNLVEKVEVRDLIDQEISRENKKLARVAQIKKFHLLAKELDHDDGDVTATMKVRRDSISSSYKVEIETMYS